MAKTKLEVMDIAIDKPRKKRSKESNRMKSADTVASYHLKELDPIPQEAYDNPVDWASNHMEKQIPQAAKELEWQLKFGDSKTRKEVALETLAFKGISNRGPNTGQVVPAIQLTINGGLPWSQALTTGGPEPKLIDSINKKDDK